MVRNSARLLAPVALAAVAVGVYLIVHANVSTTTTTARTTSSLVRSHRHAGKTHHAARPAAAVYTVKAGDTLSAIASRTGVSIVRLTRLNPSLHPPYNLQTGQKLRLRR